jgi:hypothetical protein
MSDSLIPRDLPQRVRVLQLIWIALIAMSALILGVFWYLRDEAKFQVEIPPNLPVSLSLIAVSIGLLLALLAFTIPDPVAHQVRPTMKPSFETYQVACLIRGALLEGGIVLQAVAYLLEGEWWSLAVGGALLLFLIGAVPTRDTATRWIHRQAHLR